MVAADQHDPYKASTAEHCPNATFIWDRFHIMQNFEIAINEDRKWLHEHIARDELKRLTRPKFANLFLKKADRRNKEEKRHIKDVMNENSSFVFLELIKEGMFQVYDSATADEARDKFDQLGEWIHQDKFFELQKWWKNFDQGWDTFKNFSSLFFVIRMTSNTSFFSKNFPGF